MTRLFCGFRFHTPDDVYFNVPPSLIGESFTDATTGAQILRIPKTILTELGNAYTTSMKELRSHFNIGKVASEEFEFLMRELHEKFTLKFGTYEICGFGAKQDNVFDHTVVILFEGKNGKLEKPAKVEESIDKFRILVDDMDLQGKFGFYYYDA